MAKYSEEDIKRANRATLQEMFTELGIDFNPSLKNDELREILYKAIKNEPKQDDSEQVDVKNAIAERRVKADNARIEKPSVAAAIRARKGGAASVKDAILQRRLNKK